MKIALITLLFFLNNSTKEYTYEVSVKTNFLIHNKPQLKKAFSKNELITSYKKMGYKLIYTKNHKNKSINNCFFIFEHEIKDKDFKGKFSSLLDDVSVLYKKNQTNVNEIIKCFLSNCNQEAIDLLYEVFELINDLFALLNDKVIKEKLEVVQKHLIENIIFAKNLLSKKSNTKSLEDAKKSNTKSLENTKKPKAPKRTSSKKNKI